MFLTSSVAGTIVTNYSPISHNGNHRKWAYGWRRFGFCESLDVLREVKDPVEASSRDCCPSWYNAPHVVTASQVVYRTVRLLGGRRAERKEY